MSALQDTSVVAGVLPLPQFTRPAGQTEPRAVESVEQGKLNASDYPRVYTSSAAVLQLVTGSAEGYAEILEDVEEARREEEAAAETGDDAVQDPENAGEDAYVLPGTASEAGEDEVVEELVADAAVPVGEPAGVGASDGEQESVDFYA